MPKKRSAVASSESGEALGSGPGDSESTPPTRAEHDLHTMLNAWKQELERQNRIQKDDIRNFFGELGTNLHGLTTNFGGHCTKTSRTLSVTTSGAPADRAQTDALNGPAGVPLAGNTAPAPTVISQTMAPTAERSFFNGKNMNPMRFLEALGRCFRRVGTRPNQRMDLAVDCLNDGALNWADVCKTHWTDYEAFRSDFVKNYWSVTEQNQLRRSISTDKWNPAAASMIDHLTRYVSEARLLNRPLPDAVLMSELVQHFPVHI